MIYKEVWFWLVVFGAIFILAGIVIFWFTNFDRLIAIIAGGIGTVAIILGVVIVATKGRREVKGKTAEEIIGERSRRLFEIYIPKAGKASRQIVKKGIETTDVAGRVLFRAGGVIDWMSRTILNFTGSLSLKVRQAIVIAVLGLLLSSTGSGEALWVAEIADLVGSVAGPVAGSAVSSGLGLGTSVLSTAGTSATSGIVSGLGTGIGTLGGTLGSTTLTSAGTTLGTIGASPAFAVGSSIAESLGQEGLRVGTEGLTKGSSYLSQRLQA